MGEGKNLFCPPPPTNILFVGEREQHPVLTWFGICFGCYQQNWQYCRERLKLFVILVVLWQFMFHSAIYNFIEHFDYTPTHTHTHTHIPTRVPSSGGGGGVHSTLIWTGGAAGGSKPDPVSNHSPHKKIHPVTMYLIRKLSYAYPVLVRTDSLFCYTSPYIHENLLRAASLAPRSRACHKHCGLGTRGERAGSYPVLNRVARQ